MLYEFLDWTNNVETIFICLDVTLKRNNLKCHSVPGRCFFCGSFMLFLFCFCYTFVRLFIISMLSPAGKGLTSWLSFVISNCEVVIFPLVSIVSIPDICPLSYFNVTLRTPLQVNLN